ncbi:unnamed protein product [Moneuplotes crassus]|uniref:Uncharacterized protein n=1 Tax=Euplotes crassus TaxID=5936 RepID=A0AAD1XDX5_EUPCR|nr:unnamed protein product [Moneuplotes crassus]
MVQTHHYWQRNYSLSCRHGKVGKTCFCTSLLNNQQLTKKESTEKVRAKKKEESKEQEEEYFPTVGLSVEEGSINSRIRVKLYDMGGEESYRESWEKFCRVSDAILFVVDSTDLANIHQAKDLLFELTGWPSLEGVPICIIGSKSDKEGCFSDEELIVQMELVSICDREIACFTTNFNQNHEFVKKWICDLKKRKISEEYQGFVDV